MNREILFRGKRSDSNEWLTGSLLVFEDGTHVIGSEEKDDKMITNPVISETVGQFTGLLDKEGNKIFEGDVLRSVHFKEGNKMHYLYHIVKWDNRLSGWIAQNIDTRNGNFTDQGNPQIWVYIKNAAYDIMGPIHDHPHLLNKTSNQ